MAVCQIASLYSFVRVLYSTTSFSCSPGHNCSCYVPKRLCEDFKIVAAFAYISVHIMLIDCHHPWILNLLPFFKRFWWHSKGEIQGKWQFTVFNPAVDSHKSYKSFLHKCWIKKYSSVLVEAVLSNVNVCSAVWINSILIYAAFLTKCNVILFSRHSWPFSKTQQIERLVYVWSASSKLIYCTVEHVD